MAAPDEAAVRLLMCPPTEFGVRYEINPWMSLDRPADLDRAVAQWERLRTTLETLGAQVELEPPGPGLPDQVFTANAGFTLNGRALTATFLHPERQGEEPIHEAWFAEHGYAVSRCSWPLEGAGDLCGAGEALLGGFGQRTDRRSLDEAAAWLGVDVVAVEMSDPWYYHFDMIVAPLGGSAALVASRGLSRDGARAVAAQFRDLVELTPEETEDFAANCLVIGRAAIMHRCSPRLGRELARLGLEAVEVPVGEFIKAGGAVRCMALRLDGGPAAPVSPRPAAADAPD